MKKFVAFAVATLFTAGASIAMAQCPTCTGSTAPVFSSAQPVYAAPAAPIYSQPVYSTPAPVYSAPPVASAPVYGVPADSSCGCCAGGCGTSAVFGGESTYTGGQVLSYGQETELTVGAVINGETVVSVGESTIVGTTDPGQSADSGNVIDGSVEPSSDTGEIVAPPSEDGSTPTPEEATEGDA